MTESTPPPQRIAALLVEDDDTTRLLTQKILERLGCSVETVGTGEAAMAALRTRGYDIIFLDCLLPDMTGPEVACAIRGLGGMHATMPIIGVTVDVSRIERAPCRAAAMTAWFAKPAPVTAYADALARWVPRQS